MRHCRRERILRTHPQRAVDLLQDDAKLLLLSHLRLGHFGHRQLLVVQVLVELLEDLPVEQILFNVAHDDALVDEHVVDPVKQQLHQVLHFLVLLKKKIKRKLMTLLPLDDISTS